METNNIVKLLGAGILAAGAFVAYKNYNKPGFWPGIGASFLIGWGIGALIKK